MILGQRKAHKFIWLGIVLVLPILLFFAIKDLDFTAVEHSKNMDIQLSKEGGKKFETKHVSAFLHNGKLQIQLLQPFRATSALLYELNPEGDRGKLIGQLKGKGNYKFDVAPNTRGIVVVDQIKETELLKLDF